MMPCRGNGPGRRQRTLLKRSSLITYNFDPDRFLENHQALLARKLRDGTIDRAEYRRALEELEERYHQMCARLDGTYQLPEQE